MTSRSAATASCGLMTPTELHRIHLMIMDTGHNHGWPVTDERPGLGGAELPKYVWVTCLLVGPTDEMPERREAAVLHHALFYRDPSSHTDLPCCDTASFRSPTCNPDLCWEALIPGNRLHSEGLYGKDVLHWNSPTEWRHCFIPQLKQPGMIRAANE